MGFCFSKEECQIFKVNTESSIDEYELYFTICVWLLIIMSYMYRFAIYWSRVTKFNFDSDWEIIGKIEKS